MTDSMQMSSHDMVHAVSALLEAPILTEKEETEEQALETLANRLHDNFWHAYDALEPKNVGSLVVKGISAAKTLQMSIVEIGKNLIEQNKVKVTQLYRYVMIEDDFLKDIALFQFPLALQKLGQFVMVLYRSRKKNAKDKPLLVSVKNQQKGTTLVLAVLGNNDPDYERK